MMEEQVKRAREEGRGAREMVERVKTVLRGLARGDEDGDGDLGREEGKEEGEERRVWEVVGREVGYVWYLEFHRKKGGLVGAISTDTILSSLVATSRISVPHYGPEDRVMLWPLIKKVVSCVCKPPSYVQHPRTLPSGGSFSSLGNSKSLHQCAEMWGQSEYSPWEALQWPRSRSVQIVARRLLWGLRPNWQIVWRNIQRYQINLGRTL